MLEQGRLRESISRFQLCLTMLHRLYGAKGHRIIADCLGFLSHAYLLLDRVNVAELHSRQALEVIEFLNRRDGICAQDASLLPLLLEHSVILRRCGKMTAVSRVHARMIPIAQKGFSKTEKDTTTVLKGLRIVGDILGMPPVLRACSLLTRVLPASVQTVFPPQTHKRTLFTVQHLQHVCIGGARGQRCQCDGEGVHGESAAVSAQHPRFKLERHHEPQHGAASGHNLQFRARVAAAGTLRGGQCRCVLELGHHLCRCNLQNNVE